jgi:hypothetical protein
MSRNKRTLALAGAVVAAALLVIVPVRAGGPLWMFQSGQPSLWGAGGTNIPFNPDQGGLGTLTNPEAVALTEAAFGQWEAIPSASATYVNAGPLPVDVDITNFYPYLWPYAPDGYSAIVYDETGEIFDWLYGPDSGVLGLSGPEWRWTATGEIFEGVAFLNGGVILDGLPVATFYAVEVHEFGHYSNLAHTVTNGEIAAWGDHTGPSPNNTFPPESLYQRIETMYPFLMVLPDGSDYGGVATPHPDDIAIFSTLYPAPGFFTDHGTITGVIYASDGTTKLTGVNVIARNIADPYDDAVSALSSDFTDSTSQSDPWVGVYTFNGLTPGASYAVFVDELIAGGFSTTPLFPLPGPEELYNGVDESADPSIDDPAVYTGVTVTAGVPVSGVDIIFNAPGPGDPLPVGIDGSVQLPLPFTFDFCGQSYDSVFVNANGNLTFGEDSWDYTESVTDLLDGPPRIAPFWDDLNSTAGGIVYYDLTANTFSVHWTDVPEYWATGANTFWVTLHRSSNQIDLHWDGLTAADGLAGFSCGEEITTGYEMESDLTELVGAAEEGIINGRLSPAIFELWTWSEPNDVADSSASFSAPKEFVDKGEPNNVLADATKVKLPFSSGDQIGNSPLWRYTAIAPQGADVDFFYFDVVGGTTVIAEVTDGRLDSVIGLFDMNTGTLLDYDDDGGAGLLSRLLYPVAADGTYAVAVTTYPDFDFSGDGNSGGRYFLDIETVEGVILDLGDDDTIEVPFMNFQFPYQGAMWDTVFVNSNGNLTFGAGNTDYSQSVSEFLSGPPRIAPLWDDLRPPSGGTISVEWEADSMTVKYDDIPEFFSTGANTFWVTMSANGDVTITYGTTNGNDGIVGVTEGGGATDPGETDLSAAGSLSAVGTTYEEFATGELDLDSMVLVFLGM